MKFIKHLSLKIILTGILFALINHYAYPEEPIYRNWAGFTGICILYVTEAIWRMHKHRNNTNQQINPT